TVALDAHQLSRVVAEETHRPDTELPKDLHADPVVALVRLEPEPLVGLYGIEPFVLKLVGTNLVPQTDAAPLLVQVQKHAATLRRNSLHRRVQLCSAVAPDRMEHVSGQTRGVHTHHDVLAVADFATHERYVLLVVELVLKDMDVELAECGGES